jgi:hypothetical protein
MRALLLFLLPFTAAADLTLSLSLGTNDLFTLQVTGDACQLRMELVGGKVWDYASSPHTPNTGTSGSNGNGGTTATAITFTALAPPQTISGDIDGSGLTAVRASCDGGEVVSLSGSGSSWSGTVSTTPPRTGPVRLSWTMPDAYTDGSPLTVAEIAHIELAWAREAVHVQTAPALQRWAVASPATSVELMVPEGTWHFAARTVTTNAEQSDWTLAVMGDVGAEPESPEGLEIFIPLQNAVTVEEFAYMIVQSRDSLVLLPVASVPLGTPCLGTMGANGLHVVPREAVTFPGSVQPELVLARCSAD